MTVDRSWEKLAELQQRNWELSKQLAQVEFDALELRDKLNACESAMKQAVTPHEAISGVLLGRS
jgi:hypothetical protein